jgi:ligand-binding sensor domain-containing protein
MIPICLVLGIAFCASSIAQDNVIRARRLSVSDGLSSNYTTCMVQDAKGFVWIGTREGLNIYDGHTFRKYLHHPFDSTGLQRDVINGITEDSSGNMWIATSGGGLSRLNRATEVITTYRHSASDAHSPASDIVYSLCVDYRGTLWIGYENCVLDWFDAGTESFQHCGSDPNQALEGESVFAILEDPLTRKLLLCAGATTSVFDPAGMSFVKNAIALASGQQPRCVKVCQDAAAHEWLTFTCETQSAAATSRCFRGNPLTSVFRDEYSLPTAGTMRLYGRIVYRDHGSYLLPLREMGLWEIDMDHRTSRRMTVTDGISTAVAVDDVVRDRNGSLWFVTRDGLFVSDERHAALRGEALEVPKGNGVHPSVRSLFFDHNGTQWIGGGNGLLYRYNASDDRYEQCGRMADNYGAYSLNAITEVSPGVLWISASGGPWFSYAPASGPAGRMRRWFAGSEGEMSFVSLPDSTGLVWASMVGVFVESQAADADSNQAAIACIDLRRHTMQRYWYGSSAGTKGTRAAHTVIERDRTSLWVGTEHGMYVFDKATRSFTTHYAHHDNDVTSLSDNTAWVLHRARNGRLWVGTYGAGLNCLDEHTGTFTHVSMDDGLPSNHIRSILEDSVGNLWVATSKGISCFNPAHNTFRNYTSADGLFDDEFERNACAISPEGEFYFGGTRGITHFFPAELHDPPRRSKLVFTAFHVFDRERKGELNDGDTIRLRFDENYFSFDYSLLDFGTEGIATYEYTLDGFDRGWIAVDARGGAAYNGVAPGTHVFRVRLTGDGRNSAPELRAVIVITPPWWGTWWFRGLVGIVGSIMIGIVVVARRSRERTLKRLFDEAREKERLDMAGDLHDGPLQDLYAARFFVPSIETGLNGALPDDAMRLDTLFKRALAGMQTITSQLQMPSFEAGFAMEVLDTCEAFHVRHPEIDVRSDSVLREQQPVPLHIMQNLFRLVRTTLTNVEKHSEATVLIVQFSTSGRRAELVISDNGIGFEVPNDRLTVARSRKFGLLLMRSYADAMRAELDVRSALGQGTTITVSVRW